MTGHADWAIFRHVEIQPNEVLLYLHRSKQLFVKADQFTAVQAWLNDLAALASLLETLPPPLIQAEAIQGVSRAERQKRSKFLLTAVLAILIILPICLIGVGVLTYFLVS
jgi:hypothetical protein